MKSRVSLYTSLVVVAFCLVNACFLSVHALAVTQGAASANAEERERGLALYKQGKFAEAAKVLRKVVDKNKSDDEGWYYLGLALLQEPNEVNNAAKAF